MMRAKKNLSAMEALVVVAAVLAGGLCVYGAYRGVAFALHRRRVSAAIPKYVADLKLSRDKLSAAIERYHAQFGFYPPNRSTNLAARALSNSLYYELFGTRWYSNRNSFGLPTTKETIAPAEMLKVFNMASFSNTVNAPGWPTNFLQGLGFVGREENDIIFVMSGFPEDVGDDVFEDFNVSTWRFEADQSKHNKGKFDLWMELEALGQKFEIRNW